MQDKLTVYSDKYFILLEVQNFNRKQQYKHENMKHKKTFRREEVQLILIINLNTISTYQQYFHIYYIIPLHNQSRLIHYQIFKHLNMTISATLINMHTWKGTFSHWHNFDIRWQHDIVMQYDLHCISFSQKSKYRK